MLDVATRWHEAGSLLGEFRDLLVERAYDVEPPASIVRRGWAAWLAGLSDDALTAIEARGLHHAQDDQAPGSLRELAARAAQIDAVPDLVGPRAPRRPPADARSSARKWHQVASFVEVARPLMATASRVVDVGAGHGHLTREMVEIFGARGVGFERSPALVERARRLTRGADVVFEVRDVLAEGFRLSAGDCAVALHACGELGDVLVVRAAEARVPLVLVGCCPQIRRGDTREPLCAHPEHGLDLPKSVLGLGNLTARGVGVEAPLAVTLGAYERRLTLRLLLEARGLVVAPGSEMRGLNRRAAEDDLATFVGRAFTSRGLEAPSPTAIAAAHRRAVTVRSAVRRWNVARELLARPLEVYVLLDRARYLEAHDFDVQIGRLFERAVSARNLVLLARPRG